MPPAAEFACNLNCPRTGRVRRSGIDHPSGDESIELGEIRTHLLGRSFVPHPKPSHYSSSDAHNAAPGTFRQSAPPVHSSAYVYLCCPRSHLDLFEECTDLRAEFEMSNTGNDSDGRSDDAIESQVLVAAASIPADFDPPCVGRTLLSKSRLPLAQSTSAMVPNTAVVSSSVIKYVKKVKAMNEPNPCIALSIKRFPAHGHRKEATNASVMPVTLSASLSWQGCAVIRAG